MLHLDRQDLRQITPEAFAALGAPELAYIRPVASLEGPVFGIFSADGNQVGLAESAAVALAAAREHGLEPVSVH